MRIASGFASTIAFAAALAIAGTSGTFAAHKMASHKAKAKAKPAASSAALVAKGKSLIVSDRCNTCHGADLKGKTGFSPNLTNSGVQKEYNATTWARVLSTGVTNDGGKVKPPMPIFHMSAADSKAIMAYIKTLK